MRGRQASRLSLGQYGLYVLVGVAVGLVTVVLREIFSRTLTGDSALGYSVSVVSAYGVGILLSFFLQRRVTFAQGPTDARAGDLALFGMVAIAGAVLTWTLAMVFRYALQFDHWFGVHGATAAFVLAAILASVLTYSINATVVFRHRGDRGA